MRRHRSMLIPRHSPSEVLIANGGASLVATISSRSGKAGRPAVCAAAAPWSSAAAAMTTTRARGHERPRPRPPPRAIMNSWASGGTPRRDRTVDQQHHDRADHGDDHAPEVEPGDALGAEGGEQETARDRANDTERDIEQHALAFLVDDLAGDESRDEAQNDPADDRHWRSPCGDVTNSKLRGVEGVAARGVARLEAGHEPALALRRRAVREGVGNHVALRAPLQHVVPDGRGGLQCGLDVARIEEL